MDDSREGEARKLLEGGIPGNTPACTYHRRLREYPLSTDFLIPTTVIMPGAFMPLCNHCQAEPFNQASLDVLARFPDVTDFCSCASTAIESACCYCAVTFWNLDKQAAYLARTREAEDESGCPIVVKLCGCGRVVAAPYNILQCVSCKGIASVTAGGTAPTDRAPTSLEADGGTNPTTLANVIDSNDSMQLDDHQSSDADLTQSPADTTDATSVPAERTSSIEGSMELGNQHEAQVTSPRHVIQVFDPTPEQLGAIDAALGTAGDRLVLAVEAAY